MSPAPTKESIEVSRERPYYTPRRCRVETVFYQMSNGVIVEDIELSRVVPLFQHGGDDDEPV